MGAWMLWWISLGKTGIAVPLLGCWAEVHCRTRSKSKYDRFDVDIIKICLDYA